MRVKCAAAAAQIRALLPSFYALQEAEAKRMRQLETQRLLQQQSHAKLTSQEVPLS